MNEKYLKRQLSLSDLGFPLSEDVAKLLELFNVILTPNELDVKKGKFAKFSGHYYSKNGIRIFFITDEGFYISDENSPIRYGWIKESIWEIVADKINCRGNFIETEYEISQIFSILMKQTFGFNAKGFSYTNLLNNNYIYNE